MDAAEILEQLNLRGEMPVEALRAADAGRAELLPLFLRTIEQFPQEASTPAERRQLFWIFHLLGQWRETSAYRPLATLLRGPPDVIQDTFDQAIDRTIHRVMAQVFDGDPLPLYAIVGDEEADEFVRARMCETVALVAIRGALPREEAARFLQACFSDLKPMRGDLVWDGWQTAIALLGLTELEPLVMRAFRRGSISADWLRIRNFEDDLRRGVKNPTAPWQQETDYAPFVDTIAELADWDGYGPEPYGDEDVDEIDAASSGEFTRPPGPSTQSFKPAVISYKVNPYKNVGRNDPCPCGNGKKYKKCCLNKPVEVQAATN